MTCNFMSQHLLLFPNQAEVLDELQLAVKHLLLVLEFLEFKTH